MTEITPEEIVRRAPSILTSRDRAVTRADFEIIAMEASGEVARAARERGGTTVGVITDALMTNFHLPKSTLMMLVSALLGVEEIRAVYAHAIGSGYRFFSYGDASLLIPQRSKAT